MINEIKNSPKKYISLEDFFSDDSYNPLPTLVEAARELFFSRKTVILLTKFLKRCQRLISIQIAIIFPFGSTAIS